MKPTNSSAYNLEEILALTNKELLSNWTKLASLIRPYEGISWDQAGVKARELMASGEGTAYIEAIREDVKKHPERLKEPPKQSVQKKESDNLTVYERNYVLLMEIAPELEELLVNFKGNGNSIYGKSQLTGARDLSIDYVRKDKTNFFLLLSQYSLVNGELVDDPSMEIRLNLKDRTIEALHHRDQFRSVEVYTDKVERKFVQQDERKRQNSVLGKWLKELKKQKHKVVFQDMDEDEPEVSSEIIDLYKKDEKEALKSENEKRETEEKKPVEPEEKEEKKKEAKIISLPKANPEMRFAVLQKFIEIVALREIGTLVYDPQDLNERINHILDHQGSAEYLTNAWDELQKESDKRLQELNFYRLTVFVPEILEVLNNSGEKLRLVSEKSKDAFSIELGDDRKKTSKILAIYQIGGKDKEPTMLLKVNQESKTVTVDLVMNEFSNMITFHSGQGKYADLESYQASIGLENWLMFLEENQYHLLFVNLKQVKEEEPDDSEEHDNNYVNKDIPDFEPGHVELTETHKKHHVTQKMIDRINETQKGITVYPRSQKMVYNTKNKGSDKNKQAMQPGFRMSRTGKLYYEGRSNRADRDLNNGL